MIQLSTLPATSPESLENPFKIGSSTASDGAFATMLFVELAVNEMKGGKALPMGGKNLPTDDKTLPIEGETTSEVHSLDAPSPVQNLPTQFAGKALAETGIAEMTEEDVTGGREAGLDDGQAQRNSDTLPRRATLAVINAADAMLVHEAHRPATSPDMTESDRNLAVQFEGKVPENHDAPNAAELAIRSQVKTAMKNEHEGDGAEVVVAEAVAANLVAQAPTFMPTIRGEAEHAEGQFHWLTAPKVEKDGLPAGEANGEHVADAELTARIRTDFEKFTGGKDGLAKTELKPADQPQANAATNTPRPAESLDLKFELTNGSKQAGSGDLIRTPAGQAASALQTNTPLAVQTDSPNGLNLVQVSKSAFDPVVPQQLVRPHDFNALVNRLVEARESARSGSMDLAVMHAEFGQVSLRFSQENGNLSVSMSSRDPDFVRAVNAAVPTDMPQTGQTPFQGERRDGGMMQFSQRADTGGQASSGGNSADSQHGDELGAGEQVLPEGQGRRNGLGGIFA